MIRRVAFGKSVAAGMLGAAAWETVARALIGAGVPLFDITHTLGTLVVPGAPPGIWWPVGLLLHLGVGAIWAVFYAYFFWSELATAPLVQGLAFVVIPILLAGFVMVPQFGWMHPQVLAGESVHPGVFGWRLGWGGPVGVVLGHLIYGAALGAAYTNPVGSPAHPKRAFHHG